MTTKIKKPETMPEYFFNRLVDKKCPKCGSEISNAEFAPYLPNRYKCQQTIKDPKKRPCNWESCVLGDNGHSWERWVELFIKYNWFRG